MKILKGDKVKILSGKDKGREGEVIKVFPKKDSVVVKGINLFKKHLRATKDQKGSIIEKEFPLRVAKVALVCPSCQKTTRIGYKIDKSGEKFRFCKKCQALIGLTKTRHD
ncbi:MAG TPA: 50S ribosomal protein L24 [Candidatus Woesebacteria bacterium]|nr:50S ribosomal protein L24 [Candidatus Woesebacteria bacterium]HRS23137.1 50S ribosomal protein L24 [Candidatus Woesebacteria bacterium]HRT39796.1 50S ribosomal protein L24 [Candidatus Woesebacteria bacterium]